MTNHQNQVRQFMLLCRQTVNDTPTLSPADDALRVALIREELNELKEGIANNDRVEIADALADLAYVIYGAGVTYGLVLDDVQIMPSRRDDLNDIDEIEGFLRTFIEDTQVARDLTHCGIWLCGMLEELYMISDHHSIPLDDCFEEVHRSNMTKPWTEAEVIDRAKGVAVEFMFENEIKWVDGWYAYRVENGERCWVVKDGAHKVRKSPSYTEADIAGVLARQEVGV